jgi:hypothetical protein
MARLTILLIGVALLALPAPASAHVGPLDQVDAFLAATTRGDVAGAVAMLDDGAHYQGLLICSPAACVGREAIAAALTYEVDDGTTHQLWPGTGEETTTGAVVSGEMYCRSLAPARLVYTLEAEVGPGGIASLRMEPDVRDPETRDVIERVMIVERRLDEWRAAGFDGAVTIGGLPAP